MQEESVEKVRLTKQWFGIFGIFFNRLGYCNAADVIELKGRVACEIDA